VNLSTLVTLMDGVAAFLIERVPWGGGAVMKLFDRITLNPAVMGGKACIRGLRVTVGTIIGLLSVGRTRDEILKTYPYLESGDIDQALAYAAWRVEEREVPLDVA